MFRLPIDSESFPLGKGPMVMLILFLISTLFIFGRSEEKGENLEFWIFANTHYEEYQARVPIFEAQNPGVNVQLINFGGTMHDKLLAAMLSNFGAPDLVEVEITSIGRFLKGAIDEVGFVDLRPRLESEGWMEKLVVSRFTPWSYRGRIYGIPHDLHPVVLLYRDDLFKAAGVEMTEVETWNDFIAAGKKATRDLDGDGEVDQYAIVLDRRTESDYFSLLLQQGRRIFSTKRATSLLTANSQLRHWSFLRRCSTNIKSPLRYMGRGMETPVISQRCRMAKSSLFFRLIGTSAFSKVKSRRCPVNGRQLLCPRGTPAADEPQRAAAR